MPSFIVASPGSTMMVSTSAPAPLRRNAAALLYSSDLKARDALLEAWNSDHHEAVNLSGPSMIWKRRRGPAPAGIPGG